MPSRSHKSHRGPGPGRRRAVNEAPHSAGHGARAVVDPDHAHLVLVTRDAPNADGGVGRELGGKVWVSLIRCLCMCPCVCALCLRTRVRVRVRASRAHSESTCKVHMKAATYTSALSTSARMTALVSAGCGVHEHTHSALGWRGLGGRAQAESMTQMIQRKWQGQRCRHCHENDNRPEASGEQLSKRIQEKTSESLKNCTHCSFNPSTHFRRRR